MAKTKKATIAAVTIGPWEVSGLMLPDGTYAIAVSQLAEIFQIPTKHSSRQFKALLDEGFQFPKCRSELHPKAVNILTLENAVKVIRALDRKGNETAQAFTDAILEESLERRFDTAFGKEVTEQERNASLALRMQRIKARRSYTDLIKLHQEYLGYYGTQRGKDEFRGLTTKVNLALFGQPHFKCDRDTMTPFQQRTIAAFEGTIFNKFDFFVEKTKRPGYFDVEDAIDSTIKLLKGE